MSFALTKTSKDLRAAQYLRMSTDAQKYSIENQAAAIAAYAVRRKIKVVRTYQDAGRSGLRIVGREGLQQLINTVQFGNPNFDCILVYDVSRWGRFQDVDESAYYEFICKRAGIRVHYCADEFENDGSLSSTVLKSIKRVAAADYSRQLSKKVFLGQCHVASLGYWRGGPAGYGLRRMLLTENGKAKAVLEYGQRKNLKSERVTLVPGPRSEIEVVQRIFELFAIKKKTRTEIANELNAEGICNARRKPWSMLTVGNTLKNEAYIGNLVYNRRSQKLGEPQVRNPPDMWIRHNNAFKPIIAPKLFAKTQKMLAELQGGRAMSDKELLDRLRALLRRKGRLSLQLMMMARDVPHSKIYAMRFGSLSEAYRRVGYRPQSRYCFKEIAAKIDNTICSVVEEIQADLERHGRSVTFVRELYLLMINRNLNVAVAVAKSVGEGRLNPRRWELRRTKCKQSDLTLVIRMDRANAKVQDYFLLPTANLPRTKDSRIRLCDRLFGPFQYDSFAALMSALHRRISVRPSKVPTIWQEAFEDAEGTCLPANSHRPRRQRAKIRCIGHATH